MHNMPPRKQDTTRLHLMIPRQLREALEYVSVVESRTVTDIVRAAVEAYLLDRGVQIYRIKQEDDDGRRDEN